MEESEVTVTEPPTTVMQLTTLAGSRLTHLIPEEIVEQSPIESVGELDYDREIVTLSPDQS